MKENMTKLVKALKNVSLDQFEIINQGKSKIIYRLPTEFTGLSREYGLMIFKPHLRSITYKREGNIDLTDMLRIVASLYIMKACEKAGVKTQLAYPKLVEVGNKYAMICEIVSPIKIEFIMRYYAAGSIVRNYPSVIKEGVKFVPPLKKYDLKQDLNEYGVDDPMLSEEYIHAFKLVKKNEDFAVCKKNLEMVSETLRQLLENAGCRLIDFKMELGYNQAGEIVLIDEVSQDGIRASDLSNNESITKDVFRNNSKSAFDVISAYVTFLKKVCIDYETVTMDDTTLFNETLKEYL